MKAGIICDGAEYVILGEEDKRDGDILEGDNPGEGADLVRQYGILLPCRAVSSDTLPTEISSCGLLLGLSSSCGAPNSLYVGLHCDFFGSLR